MEMPATEPRPAADQHDAALTLALGLLSAVRRFEGSASRASRSGATALAADDPVVLSALGAVSVGRTLTRWLEEAAKPREVPRVDLPAGASPTPRELFR